MEIWEWGKRCRQEGVLSEEEPRARANPEAGGAHRCSGCLQQGAAQCPSPHQGF